MTEEKFKKESQKISNKICKLYDEKDKLEQEYVESNRLFQNGDIVTKPYGLNLMVLNAYLGSTFKLEIMYNVVELNEQFHKKKRSINNNPYRVVKESDITLLKKAV